jgi:hypothetical protein
VCELAAERSARLKSIRESGAVSILPSEMPSVDGARVFISYSGDSDEHRAEVGAFARLLDSWGLRAYSGRT